MMDRKLFNFFFCSAPPRPFLMPGLLSFELGTIANPLATLVLRLLVNAPSNSCHKMGNKLLLVRYLNCFQSLHSKLPFSSHDSISTQDSGPQVNSPAYHLSPDASRHHFLWNLMVKQGFCSELTIPSLPHHSVSWEEDSPSLTLRTVQTIPWVGASGNQ